MEKLKPIKKSRIDRIKYSPSKSGLAYKDYGRSENILDYSDREISEMIYGIYKDSKNLLVDDDYFVDLTKVTATKCILGTVTYFKKPNTNDYKTNNHNQIDNIRTFYIKDYFLITDQYIFGNKEHRITRYLHKIGCLKQGRNRFKDFYRVSPYHRTLLYGKYPKDLYHPIKRYINGLFFNDDYRIREFIFESELIIHSGR